MCDKRVSLPGLQVCALNMALNPRKRAPKLYMLLTCLLASMSRFCPACSSGVMFVLGAGPVRFNTPRRRPLGGAPLEGASAVLHDTGHRMRTTGWAEGGKAHRPTPKTRTIYPPHAKILLPPCCYICNRNLQPETMMQNTVFRREIKATFTEICIVEDAMALGTSRHPSDCCCEEQAVLARPADRARLLSRGHAHFGRRRLEALGAATYRRGDLRQACGRATNESHGVRSAVRGTPTLHSL